MEIKWRNIFALALVVFAIVLFLRNRTEMAGLWSTVQGITSNQSPEDRVTALICLALICICVITVVRALLRDDRDDRRGPGA